MKLKKNYKFWFATGSQDLYGDELMNVGLIISDSSCGENKDGIGDYYSCLLYTSPSPRDCS